MERAGKKTLRFGLVGKNISYSFSKPYFEQKFKDLGLVNHSYENFDIPKIEEFPAKVIRGQKLRGLNVTIPYKEAIIPYLDGLSEEAGKIRAVNTIKFSGSRLIGFNTDVYGFRESLLPLLREKDTKALILGTGGASKAVAYTFDELRINYQYVSRNPLSGQLGYNDLTMAGMQDIQIVVNCTPLGTFPNIDEKPDLPYNAFGSDHLLFDLVYNPEKTAFLKEGENQGARIINGRRMLELQAEKSWEIWNS